MTTPMPPHDEHAGDWQALDTPGQLPRYAAIAGLLQTHKCDHKVLDVGCGEALLRAWLPRDADYTGIEPSSLALQRPLRGSMPITLIHTSAERYDAQAERFSCIVFNEMLYYSVDPVGLLRKFQRFLLPEGRVLCSIYQDPRPISLKRKLLGLVNHRRPQSNVHCTELVHAFMLRETWAILETRSVPIPGTAATWKIWLAQPPD